MGAYGNGMTTRQMILDACAALFYEKGYHETSYDDICRTAHVNRGSIYYHFKEKENIRYEILWMITTDCYEQAKIYCDDSRYTFLVGMYLHWGKVLHDEKIRKFELDYYADYPVYTPNNPVARYYKMCNEKMYREIWDLSGVDLLAVATGYGTLYGGMRLLDDGPEKYNLIELYRHLLMTGILTWGIPKAEADVMWEEVLTYIRMIPDSVIEAPWRQQMEWK